MNRRIKKTFDAKGIEIPFPHRTIYVKQTGQGPGGFAETRA
jgi:small-conductance mechanosensitive channel